MEDGTEEKLCVDKLEERSERMVSEDVKQDTAVFATAKPMISFVPSSDAETSTVAVTAAVENDQTATKGGIRELDDTDSILVELPIDTANDAESSGSYELIDEGRVYDMLDELTVEHKVSTGEKIQDATSSGEQNVEMVEDQVEQFSAVDDVHDVQVCACFIYVV